MTEIICGAGYYGCPRGEEHHFHCRHCGAISPMSGHYDRNPSTGEFEWNCPPSENQQRYVHVSRIGGTPVQISAEEEDGPYED